MMTIHIDMTLEEANEFIESYGWIADKNGIKTPIKRAEKRRCELQKMNRCTGLSDINHYELLKLDKAIGLILDQLNNETTNWIINTMNTDLIMKSPHELMTIDEAHAYIDTYGGLLPHEVAEQRRSKLQKAYRSSGLCTDDYKEMMMLDKAIGLVMGQTQ